MGDLLQGVLLALVQGLTEFLPISSSAHLILPSQLLGWRDQGLVFDVAVHLGSLVAVLAYYRRQVLDLLLGCVTALRSGQMNADAGLSLHLVIATIPVVLVGVAAKALVEGELRTLPVIASTTIGFGLLLAAADRRRGTACLNSTRAFIIGCAQVLAIVPGTSRSGITMTAGLFLGLDRDLAVRFSFLLSIPVILAAGLLASIDIWQSATAIDFTSLGIGFVVSALAAYCTIHWFITWVNRIGFMPFVAYRCMLGGLLWFIWLTA